MEAASFSCISALSVFKQKTFPANPAISSKLSRNFLHEFCMSLYVWGFHNTWTNQSKFPKPSICSDSCDCPVPGCVKDESPHFKQASSEWQQGPGGPTKKQQQGKFWILDLSPSKTFAEFATWNAAYVRRFFDKKDNIDNLYQVFMPNVLQTIPQGNKMTVASHLKAKVHCRPRPFREWYAGSLR